MIDPETLRVLWQSGSPVILMVAVWFLWQDLRSERKARATEAAEDRKRYEVVLERCVTALVRINDKLEQDDEGN